jgi:hypothetical protein
MVASANGDHAALPCCLVECLNTVERSAQFEGAGLLKQFKLEPDFASTLELIFDDAGLPVPDWGVQDFPGQAVGGVADLGQRGIGV